MDTNNRHPYERDHGVEEPKDARFLPIASDLERRLVNRAALRILALFFKEFAGKCPHSHFMLSAKNMKVIFGKRGLHDRHLAALRELLEENGLSMIGSCATDSFFAFLASAPAKKWRRATEEIVADIAAAYPGEGDLPFLSTEDILLDEEDE